ncbi:Na(+)/H(+) antiporter NhaA [Virgisporangium aliadipatigenens]|uniref:Na(+)/H(+) antiporter NhaA n=1 Tax=Virgisporangium aliadipatigenens TaxID=741659 RepID=A0A8J3YI48_9ACTN|nr:Na+/H+ antiporter NhaA [Virgisporangium aliadipatigenens]GIJ44376.1 Na(+)/H(+) antiporter NhaA [Virgisporangium aliadipatigenens]
MPRRTPLLTRGSWPEVSRIGEILRTETIGGVFLLVAAVLALGWANSPWQRGYHDLAALRVGPAAWHLDLTLAAWASDALLAIFFFLAGLELKREFVAGDLRDPRRAALPVIAAVGGMAGPAGIYVAVHLARGSTDALVGWAVPTATDVAFALAVLGVISTHLPAALRTFLLTLAIVDDLLGILVIGIFYTDGLRPLAFLLALVPVAAFAVVLRWRGPVRLLLPALAVAAWLLVHESGVHATIAGVLLGFAVPMSDMERAERLEHFWRPVSAGFAVPVFAFFAAGVTVVGAGSTGVLNTITVSVVLALILGKTVGVLGSTWLMHRFTRAQLSPDLGWWDVVGVSVLAGMGFTVSLLIGELAFGTGTARDAQAKVGVLIGSLLAAVLAGVILRLRNRRYRALCAVEELDLDGDGIPDVYQTEKP